MLCQTSECLESAPFLSSPDTKSQELAGTLPWDKVRRFSCADPAAVVLPWVSLVSLAAGVCQKHVLHLLPGMSSDSDIECDTENEEQEDATSPSEVFNQAFSVQPSSEGRADRAPLPKHSQSSQSSLGTDPWGGGCGGVQAQETASKIWNSSLGIPIKTAQNRRGKLLLALRSQFR